MTAGKTMRAFAAYFVLVASATLSGCASHDAYRTQVVNRRLDSTQCPANSAGETPLACAHRTPEVVDGKYELHFVEFDDQGWVHPRTNAGPDAAPDQSAMQIDALIDDLKQNLRARKDLKVIMFIHGWKHDASADDDNVKKFRRLLERAASDELYQQSKRQVIGIYVGWRGKPWLVPDPVLDLSFWSRKETASRVSTGSVRELFARLRSLQRYFNLEALKDGRRPAMRTLMIGHSFGGLILYSATSGPLIETLTEETDLADLPPLHTNASNERTAEAERVADMIVLVNPAFEASRFEALYRVANRQTHRCYVPPMFMSITSVSDDATGIAFPAGRFVNTIFERPTSSAAQVKAIKQTPGHDDAYITHLLHGPDGNSAVCKGWTPGDELLKLTDDTLAQKVKTNKQLEVAQSQAFIAQLNAHGTAPSTWQRTFCGGATLEVKPMDGMDHAGTLVWNIKADASIINGHGDVMNHALLDFVRQMFGDTDLPKDVNHTHSACAD
ncbi:hypothetical protein ACOCG7_34065 (plasmid) [Paraburkholderia sp. DD10]|uniref:hypothetical protein n=1 Tax=Paraburkholderia sp. DD10 TaxID=3409691 RepID=UPI003BA2DCF8